MLLSEAELNRIISKLDNEDYWFSQLGRESNKLKPKRGTKAAYNFTQIGRVKYNWAKRKLYVLMYSNGKPKKNLSFLIDGEPRDIIQAILTTILIHLETTIAIATPLTALIVSKGLVQFCKVSKPTVSKKPKSTKSKKAK